MRILHGEYLAAATCVCLLPPRADGGSCPASSSACGDGGTAAPPAAQAQRFGRPAEATRAALQAALHTCELFAIASVAEPTSAVAPQAGAQQHRQQQQPLGWYGQLKACHALVDAAVRRAVRQLHVDSSPAAGGLRSVLGCEFYDVP